MQRPSRRRTPSDLPGLDIAEQKSWQNFLHAALRFHTTMDRWLTEAHHLSVIDLRVLDILTSPTTVRHGWATWPTRWGRTRTT